MLIKKTLLASWDKIKALIYFKISQLEFISVEIAQTYILV